MNHGITTKSSRFVTLAADFFVEEKETKLADAPLNSVSYHKGRFMKIEIEKEEDGRWIAEIPELPGVMVYGDTRNQAISKAEALALRVLADRLENEEEIPELKEIFAVSA
jgi:predicted RNase H-like HicB family nuclease